MAYEYERINNIGCVTSPISTDQAVEELQEVYRKAKFLDEVIKKVKTEFVSEDLADAIRILVNDYEYDKEDE